MNMKIAASFWCLDLLDVKNIPAIALQELTEGDDTRSLRFLAGATHDSSLEIEQLFKRTLVELSITIPDKFEAGNQVAAYYAHAIISGQITPYTGARKIWFDVYNHCC